MIIIDTHIEICNDHMNKSNKYFYISCTDYARECPSIRVSLRNNVLTSQGDFKGIYHISNTINGKQSWRSTSKAIWHISSNRWLIGYNDYIGEDSAYIFTKGQFSQMIVHYGR